MSMDVSHVITRHSARDPYRRRWVMSKNPESQTESSTVFVGHGVHWTHGRCYFSTHGLRRALGDFTVLLKQTWPELCLK